MPIDDPNPVSSADAPVPTFSITARRDGDGQVIACSGELDIATAPQLEAAVGEHDEGPLTIDLRDVSFVDSSGVRAIVAADRRCERIGSSLTLICDGQTQRVLETCGVLDHLSVRSS